MASILGRVGFPGSPMFCQKTNGQYELIGIGLDLNFDNSSEPTKFVNVLTQWDWIESVLSRIELGLVEDCHNEQFTIWTKSIYYNNRNNASSKQKNVINFVWIFFLRIVYSVNCYYQ